MAKTLEQILHHQNLIGLIQTVKGGLPNSLPPSFLKVTRKLSGKSATWLQVQNNRRTARLVQYGAPSVRRAQTGVTERSAIMMHSFEHQLHEPATLMQLKDYENETKQNMGMQTIASQVTDFNMIFENLRLSAVYSILRFGAIYFDGDGNLLPSSSGAVTTVSFNVPSGNLNQLDVLGAGAIIGASWATAGTDIIGDIDALKRASVQLTGYPIAHAFYGTNTLGYLLGNTALTKFLSTRGDYAGAFATHTIPPGFLGLQWHPLSGAFFQDAAGTNQEWFGADTVVFTPEPSPDWWEMIEGSYPVPTSIGNIAADAVGAMSNVKEVNGMFSYAKVLDDPVTIKHLAGDTFLPTLKVPGAIFISDVTP